MIYGILEASPVLTSKGDENRTHAKNFTKKIDGLYKAHTSPPFYTL